jgi:hypothetical protein
VVAVHDDGGFQATVRVAVSADEVVSVSIPKSPDQPCPWKPGDAAAVSFQPDRLRVLAAR